MAYRKYSDYMNQRYQATSEGRKLHEESVRQIKAIKTAPKKALKAIKRGVKKLFRYDE